MWSVSRRRFIAGLAAALGLRWQPAWSQDNPSARLVLRILAARAGYAPTSDEDRARFVADFLVERWWVVLDVLRTTSFLRLYETALFPLLASRADLMRLHALEREVVTAYLTGTGFFESADGRPLRYRGPRAGACANPFARFD